MSDCVSKLTTDLLVHELKDVTRWEYLGFYLGFGMADIKEIEQDHPDTARRRMEMLHRWMRKEVSPSWVMVIEALEKMSEQRLAHQLREKYCTLQHQDEKPPTNTSEDQTDSQAIERVLEVDREDEVGKGIEGFELKYLKIVSKVEAALKRENPSARDIKRFSNFYMSKEVTKVEELIDQLEPLDYLNYTMLETIINYFLKQDQSMVSELNGYIQDLKKFKDSTSVKKFMESIEAAQKPLSETEIPGKITVKLQLIGKWLDTTMSDLDKLLKVLFRDKSSVLSHIKIEKGSVIVTYLAPQTEVDSLIMIAAGKVSFMVQVGVIELQVGDTVVTSTQNETSDFSFESSLIKSVKNNDVNVLSFLLDINTSPDATDIEGHTPLMCASQLGNSKAVDVLLKANANPNIPRQDGETPLHFASLDGHSNIVGMLLHANASPNLQTVDGYTPLVYAIRNGHSHVVGLLLEANANPNLQDAQGIMPLHVASLCEHSDIVRLLLNAGVNPNSQEEHGVTPLVGASQVGHSDVVRLLLEANADPNIPDSNGLTPLYAASDYYGYTEVVSLLLKAKADPNLQEGNGQTPLYIASFHGHFDIVGLLVKANANPSIQANNGETPLHVASMNGHCDVANLLLEAGADPNLQTHAGATPLMAACNNHQVVQLLLASGADPNFHTDDGTTPLIFACFNHQVVHLLLTSGADPNYQMANMGFTALMLACHCGYFESAEELLMNGANSSLQSYDGLTALDLAACSGHDDIVDLIQAIELSQSSSTSPVRTATEITANVDNEALASLYQAMEKMLLEKTESIISAKHQQLEKIIPYKQEQELQQFTNIF